LYHSTLGLRVIKKKKTKKNPELADKKEADKSLTAFHDRENPYFNLVTLSPYLRLIDFCNTQLWA